MPRIGPVHWKKLECVFLALGFTFHRQHGSHRAYVKTGVTRPIIIPTYSSVDVDIIAGLLRTAGVKREEYLKCLKKC
jgi:predicted RNA binding protein YcfA (HicA-like mRNA interferase family)